MTTRRPTHISVRFTPDEFHAVMLCLSGEAENDDGRSGFYFNPLRRAMRKLNAAWKKETLA